MMTLRRGLSLIELLCVISIMIALAALLQPVFVQAIFAAKQTSSMANLRSLHQALMVYTVNHDLDPLSGRPDQLPSLRSFFASPSSILGKDVARLMEKSPCGVHPQNLPSPCGDTTCIIGYGGDVYQTVASRGGPAQRVNIFADLSCNSSSTDIYSKRFRGRAIVVTVEGRAMNIQQYAIYSFLSQVKE